MKAKKIEVRFIKLGIDGFDVIDDGIGIDEKDFTNLCKTLPNRERNEIYKSRSLGYMGETLYSLCKSSDVKIFTRHAQSPHGFKLIYNSDGDLVNKIKIEKEDVGTTIEVRCLHKINPKSSFVFKKYIKEMYENATNHLSMYSFILKDVALAVTIQLGQSAKDLELGRKTIKTYWVKPAHSDLKSNVGRILKNQYGKNFFSTAEDLTEFSFGY